MLGSTSRMAWLARLDARAARSPRPLFWVWRTLMTLLALLGAYAWIGLWYERHPILGIAQFVLCAWLFWTQVMVPWRASASSATPQPPPRAPK